MTGDPLADDAEKKKKSGVKIYGSRSTQIGDVKVTFTFGRIIGRGAPNEDSPQVQEVVVP